MIAEGVLTFIFIWLLYWIDLERKLSGRPGIPFIGTLFDQVQINVSETFNDKSMRAPPSVNTTSDPPPVLPASTKRSTKAAGSKPAPAPVAVAPATQQATGDEQVQETSTATTTSDVNTDNSAQPSKDKKRKKKKRKSRTRSKGSKNKKRTRRHHKKKSGKHKKRDKESKETKEKDSPPHDDISTGSDGELTPDITQTETYDPSAHGPKPPVPDDFNPGRSPSDATAQSGENVIDDEKRA